MRAGATGGGTVQAVGVVAVLLGFVAEGCGGRDSDDDEANGSSHGGRAPTVGVDYPDKQRGKQAAHIRAAQQYTIGLAPVLAEPDGSKGRANAGEEDGPADGEDGEVEVEAPGRVADGKEQKCSRAQRRGDEHEESAADAVEEQADHHRPDPAIPCCMENAREVAALESPKVSFQGLKNAVNPDPITPDQ